MTTTSNLGLTQPSASDLVDAAIVASNFETIDEYIAFMQVSVKEDVVNPFSGLKVMEASGALYIYITGQGWVSMGAVGGGGSGTGKKAYASITSNGGSTSATELMSNIKATFTAETGRRYWVETNASFNIFVGTDEAMGVRINFYWSNGSSVTISDTLINNEPYTVDVHRYASTNQYATFFGITEFVPNVNGLVTVGLSYEADHGCSVNSAGSSAEPNIVTVRDVGV